MPDMESITKELRNLRDDITSRHTENKERMDRFTVDLNSGFEKVRGEMQAQNGRVGRSETKIAVLETNIIPLQRAVYSVIGLMGAGFIGAVMALIFGHTQ